MAIIPKFYFDAVVSIGIRDNNAVIKWIGTGFFIIRKIDEEGNARPFLVTNKHVVEKQKSIVIRMKDRNDDTLRTINLSLEENEKALVFFHESKDIDIAVIPVNGYVIVENHLEFFAFDIDEHAMTSTELRLQGAEEGTLIHMLGFPLGLVNKDSGQPLCRLGCIARISKTQIEEEHDILVDVQNFPGNSGSPVVTRPEIVSIEGTKCLNRAILIGIVHSYIPYQDFLVSQQTNEVVEIRRENSGIANVHPVEYIREIIDTIQPAYYKEVIGEVNL